MRNAQQALRAAVSERWQREPEIEALMVVEAEMPVSPLLDIEWAMTKPPLFSVEPSLHDRRRTPVRTDFLKLEAERRDLGLAGERAVLDLERRMLSLNGQDRLARMVEHVSQTRGDGLGYDVLSFDPEGNEKFIEVKTTRKQREFPFLVANNEVEFSKEERDRFHLYRVYDFGRQKTGLFMLEGELDSNCLLTPTMYAARPNQRASVTQPIASAS